MESVRLSLHFSDVCRYLTPLFSVSIRVGTPPQWVDVFVSTASQETWVVGPGGCDGSKFCCS